MKPQYTIATNKYGHYCIPLSSAHRPCAQTILAGDVHEPDTIQFILDHAGDGDVIHAGAYFGDMLPALSKNIKGNLFPFEPNSYSFRCAAVTRILNKLPLPVLHFALSNKQDYAQLKNIDSTGRMLGGGSKIVRNDKMDKDQFETVVTKKIDYTFFNHPISIIHLDIEGSEQLALTGAMDTITRCKPMLILETLPSSEWIEANLTNLGYKITDKVHSNSILECVS